jgi:glucosylceramidase
VNNSGIEFWLTKSDQTALLQIQPGLAAFANIANNYTDITVDSTLKFQPVDGFGFTLTGGSAQLINAMSTDRKSVLLQELFGKDRSSIGISYLRISIGASDLNQVAFTYDDISPGQTDTALVNFKLDADKEGGTGLIPLLKEILAINPDLKIIATPWSAPVWMKDNNSFTGGSLKTQYYNVYARYFVKYIQQMQVAGIPVDAITPQNEPLNPGNTPSLVMTAVQQRDFIKNNLGPALRAAGLTVKIIVYDHNCDQPGYPLTILVDGGASAYVDGSAFHLYAGDIGALTTVHNAFPDKAVYFTEQWTSGSGSFNGDFQWHIKNVLIGSMRNWSRVALEWNLANDPSFNPHTPGGCSECKGAITINGSAVQRNVAYYIIAQASKFVPAGSVRIGSNNDGNLSSVAFYREDGKKVLIVLNEGRDPSSFNIKFNGNRTTARLPGGSAGTFIW